MITWTRCQVGDPQEVNAIADFFCNGRPTPLLIGSVKSNMGHSEPASSLCSIAKMLIAMETGVIPQNLHFKTPNPEIPAPSDGRLQVIRIKNSNFIFLIKTIKKKAPMRNGYLSECFLSYILMWLFMEA